MAGMVAMLAMSSLTSWSWYCWEWLRMWLVKVMCRENCEAKWILSAAHAISVFGLRLLDSWGVRDGWFCASYKANTTLEKAAMIGFAGYVMHDAFQWTPSREFHSIALMAQQVVSFLGIVMVLSSGCGGAYLIDLYTMMTFSNPVLLARYYLEEACANTKVTEIIYLMLFVVLRFMLGSRLSWKIMSDCSVPSHVKASVTCLYLTNLALLPGVCRKALQGTPLTEAKKREKIFRDLKKSFKEGLGLGGEARECKPLCASPKLEKEFQTIKNCRKYRKCFRC